jgi:eukaryotic-like serine/threonine-protein kinase
MSAEPDPLLPDGEDLLDEAYLDYLKGEDAGAAPDLQELLARHPQLAGDPELVDKLRQLVAGGKQFPTSPPPVPDIPPGRRIAGYEVLERLGEGGMGVVYRARQLALNKEVALKFIAVGRLADAELRRRFLDEAETAAGLEHRNIVPIIEAGEHDGLLYFSMKLVKGGSLARLPAGFVLNSRKTARLVACVARAVHHAHQSGILHRDLKPANILLDKDGEPFVADFGLAKRLPASADTVGGDGPDRSTGLSSGSDVPAPSARRDMPVTQTNMIVGTPSYMAPEQTRSAKRLTTRADVYGLGTILYELLTGRAPFVGEHVGEILQRVREQEPVAPRAIKPAVNRDLETICLMCLRKEPDQRYASAEALAEDLERWLNCRPIKARPVSLRERAWKWARRNPAVAALLLTVVLAVGAGAGAFVWQWRQTRAALVRAETELYRGLISHAQAQVALRRPDRARELLDDCPAERRDWEWYYLRRLCHLEDGVLTGHPAQVVRVAYSPDGESMATADMSGTIILWDVARGTQRRWQGHTLPVTSLCFIGEGRDLKLVTAGADFHVKVWQLPDGGELGDRGAVEISVSWQLPDGGELPSPPGNGQLVTASRSGDRLATLHDHCKVVVWERTRSPDGKLRYQEKAWQGKEKWPFDPEGERILALALSPDGRYLAVAGYDPRLSVWDLEHHRKVPGFVDRGLGPNRVWTLAFSNDGAYLAAGSTQPTVWEVKTGRLVRYLLGSSSYRCQCIGFNRDGKRVFGTYQDGRVRVWDAESGMATLAPRKQDGDVAELVPGAAFCPKEDPRHVLLAVCRGRRVTIENVVPPRIPGDPLPGHRGNKGSSLAFGPDQRPLVLCCEEGRLRTWDAVTGREREKAARAIPDRKATRAVFSRDGRRLATTDGLERVTVWDTEEDRQLFSDVVREGQINGLAFDPEGGLLAACGVNGLVKVWDVNSGEPRFRCSGHTGEVTWVTFSPDGKLLATAGEDRTVRLWDARDGRERSRLEGHSSYVSCVAYSSPDGRRLASCGGDGLIKLWDTGTGQEVLTLSGHNVPVTAVVFSRGGHLLASYGDDGKVLVWDATPLKDGQTP